jgi:hypothetical protein
MQQVEQAAVTALPSQVYDLVTLCLGQYLLARVNHRQVRALPPEIHDNLWNYLEEIDYFLDPSKKQSYAQQRLADLDAELYHGLVQHLGQQMKEEIWQQQVADLDEGTRQALRQYLDSIGYFVNQEDLASTDGWTVADLKREDYEGLALFLGQRELDEHKKSRITDLSQEMQSSVLQYLRQAGYFLDREKLRALEQQTLDNLGEETRTALLEHLRQQHEETLLDRRLANQDTETRLAVEQFLRERGLAVPVTEMQQLDGQRLADLPVEEHDYLMRYLGSRQLEEAADMKLNELDRKVDGAVSAYLGRQVMRGVERRVMLHFINYLWIDYLTDIEDLRQGIGLEAYGQRDPLVQYKIKAFEMFEELQANICRSVVANVFRWPPQPLRWDS